MITVNDEFENAARQIFGLLEAEYGLQLCEVTKDNYGCCLTYKGVHLAVKVSREIYDGGIFVRFYKLKDGKIPAHPIFFDSKEEFLIFDLNDLLLLRQGAIISQDPQHHHEPAYNASILRQYALALKKYASDALKGDFSVWEAVKPIVVRRAKELENEM